MSNFYGTFVKYDGGGYSTREAIRDVNDGSVKVQPAIVNRLLDVIMYDKMKESTNKRDDVSNVKDAKSGGTSDTIEVPSDNKKYNAIGFIAGILIGILITGISSVHMIDIMSRIVGCVGIFICLMWLLSYLTFGSC